MTVQFISVKQEQKDVVSPKWLKSTRVAHKGMKSHPRMKNGHHATAILPHELPLHRILTHLFACEYHGNPWRRGLDNNFCHHDPTATISRSY
jgi:hypothetical protein